MRRRRLPKTLLVILLGAVALGGLTSLQAHHGVSFYEPRALRATDGADTTGRWLLYSATRMIAASQAAVAPGHGFPVVLSALPATQIARMVGAYLRPESPGGIASRSQTGWADPVKAKHLQGELAKAKRAYELAERSGDSLSAAVALRTRNRLNASLEAQKIFGPDEFAIQSTVMQNGRWVARIGRRAYGVGDSIKGLYITRITTRVVRFTGWHVSLVRSVSK